MWQKRYFVLENKMLKYYKNEAEHKESKIPRGVLNFQQIWIESEFEDDKMKVHLLVKGTTRTFHLKSNSKADYEKWKQRLYHSTNTSIGKINKQSLDVNDQRYWRNLRISESGVINEA